LQELPQNYDLFYLGGNHLKTPQKEGNFLCKITNTLTTHAYCINSKIFDLLIDNMMKDGAEIDNYYTKIQSNLNSYCIVPAIMTQSEGYSDILGRVVNYKAVIH
jgi:hypothetical protein